LADISGNTPLDEEFQRVNFFSFSKILIHQSSSMLSRVVVVALLSVAYPVVAQQAATCPDFGLLFRYNLVTNRDFTGQNSDVEGRMFVNGLLSVSNYAVGEAFRFYECAEQNHVEALRVNWQSGNLNGGRLTVAPDATPVLQNVGNNPVRYDAATNSWKPFPSVQCHPSGAYRYASWPPSGHPLNQLGQLDVLLYRLAEATGVCTDASSGSLECAFGQSDRLLHMAVVNKADWKGVKLGAFTGVRPGVFFYSLAR
jgi:choice-of-anchor A domain-containing protein